MLKYPRLREDGLRMLAVLLIAVVAGPDLLALVELTTLLDALGAALFLMTFVVGARILIGRYGSTVRSLFLPQECECLLRVPLLTARAFALTRIGFNALRLVMAAILVAGLLSAWIR